MADFLGPSDYFEGTIFARGLQLPESPTFVTPSTESQITWIRESSGALVARVYADNDGSNGARLDSEAKNALAGLGATNVLRAIDSIGGKAAEVFATADASGGASVFLAVGSE